MINSIVHKPTIEWVSIPSGTFIMGATNESEKDNEQSRHKVTLSAFKMSKYAVTFEQYDIFCEATKREKADDYGWGRGNRPVISVTFNDARSFAEWMGCRLPTEAEWEYACRAGTISPFNTGDNLTTMQANYNGNYPFKNIPKGENRDKTMPVGSFLPNSWGLFDMHGNVSEWCSDWYGSYSSEDQIDPEGSSSGSRRVVTKAGEDLRIYRGGSYICKAYECQSSYRGTIYPSARGSYIGFRLVYSDSKQEQSSVETVKDLKNSIYNTNINTATSLRSNIHVYSTIEWINIPEGTFIMGSPFSEEGRGSDETQHLVTLSKFRISKYAVTFEQFDLFCEATNREKHYDGGWGRNDRPAIKVSWEDANAFATWISCRLPTEAEWEYCCRAGTTTPFYTGDNLTSDYANFDDRYSGKLHLRAKNKTLPVGCLAPNSWGLYDMHGNVWEWCNDKYGTYSEEAQINPKGPTSGWFRVFRGGAWNSFDSFCRSANRFGSDPADRGIDIGFRIVFQE